MKFGKVILGMILSVGVAMASENTKVMDLVIDSKLDLIKNSKVVTDAAVNAWAVTAKAIKEKNGKIMFDALVKEIKDTTKKLQTAKTVDDLAITYAAGTAIAQITVVAQGCRMSENMTDIPLCLQLVSTIETFDATQADKADLGKAFDDLEKAFVNRYNQIKKQ